WNTPGKASMRSWVEAAAARPAPELSPTAAAGTLRTNASICQRVKTQGACAHTHNNQRVCVRTCAQMAARGGVSCVLGLGGGGGTHVLYARSCVAAFRARSAAAHFGAHYLCRVGTLVSVRHVHTMLHSLTHRALLVSCLVGAAFGAPWVMNGARSLPHFERRAAIAASRSHKHAAAPAQPWANFTQTQYWYNNQTLDHFNLVDNRTYSQRYWLVTDFWSAPTAPVILYLCGEYTCPGVMASRLFPLELAYEHGALVVVVEHRFYGESQPFGNLASENLVYLNSRQALEDLAQISLWLQAQINTNASLPADTFNQWFVIGGSYPGALSAWYRTKYPHLSVGSLASSGVVNAFIEYPQFDEQVATSAGPDCANALRNVTAQISVGMPWVKSAFNASQLSDGDFWFFVADAGAEGVQYGARHELCDAMTAAWLAGANPLPYYINYTLNYWETVMGNSADDYDSNLMADPVNGGDGTSLSLCMCM
ncbi:hypothetical protein EON67_02475, partial [archaeon]